MCPVVTWQPSQSARVAFGATAGCEGGSAAAAWHSPQASGPGVLQATLFGGAPFGKWHATVQLGGTPATRSIVPPAVVVPPANVYGTSNPKVAPLGWQCTQANMLRCFVWTSSPAQFAPELRAWLEATGFAGGDAEPPRPQADASSRRAQPAARAARGGREERVRVIGFTSVRDTVERAIAGARVTMSGSRGSSGSSSLASR